MLQPAANADDDFSAIQRHYLDKTGAFHLTPKQIEKLKIIETAHDLLKDYGFAEKAYPILSKRFPVNGKPMSRAQCYRYFANAQALFGAQFKLNKDYYKGWLLTKAYESYIRGIERKDGRLEAAALKELSKILDLANDDLENDNLKQLILTKVEIHLDPEKIGLPRIENVEQITKKYLKQKHDKYLTEDDVE